MIDVIHIGRGRGGRNGDRPPPGVEPIASPSEACDTWKIDLRWRIGWEHRFDEERRIELEQRAEVNW